MLLVNPDDYIRMMYNINGKEAITKIRKALDDFVPRFNSSMEGKYYKTDYLYIKVVLVNANNNNYIDILVFSNDDTFDGVFYDASLAPEDFFIFDPVEITQKEFMEALEKRISKI